MCLLLSLFFLRMIRLTYSPTPPTPAPRIFYSMQRDSGSYSNEFKAKAEEKFLPA